MVGGWDPDGVDDGGVWRFYKLEVLNGTKGGKIDAKKLSVTSF